MKDELKAFYFPHDIGASNDPKLIDIRVCFGWKAIGMYWAIIEALHKEDNGSLPKHLVTSMIVDFYRQEKLTDNNEPNDFEEALYTNVLLETDGRITTSKRVVKNIDERRRKSDLAKKSVEARWGNSNKHKTLEKHTDVLPTQYERNTIKERKGKEIKDINPLVSQFLSYFNQKTKKNLSLNDSRKRIIEGRLKLYTINQLMQAVDNFVKDDWPDRAKFTDVIYCIGVRNNVDNLEKWLSVKPNSTAWVKP